MTRTRRNSAILRFFLFALLCTQLLCIAGPASAADSKAGRARDFQQLEGRWVRPDGGYIIELKGIKEDGSVSAAYFNPMPIRVYRAEVKKRNGKTALFIELRDVNYPGSKYNLIYDAATDRLRGTYFQAVEKKTFNVEFIRRK